MKIRELVALCIVLFPAAVSFADVVEYDTDEREQWFIDVGGPTNVSTVDFTGYDDLTPISDQWAHLGVNFSSSGFVVTSGFDDFLHPNDGWGALAEPDINITFDAPINWIGTDFPGGFHVYELYNDDELLYTSSPAGFGGPGHFSGLIADEPFNRVRIYNTVTVINGIDDLHFGPPINVPAPGGLIVLCSAALVTRRRRVS